jgi:hypothetical protein
VAAWSRESVDTEEDVPHPSEIPPAVLVCAQGHKTKARNETLVLLATGSGLSVEFERAPVD